MYNKLRLLTMFGCLYCVANKEIFMSICVLSRSASETCSQNSKSGIQYSELKNLAFRIITEVTCVNAVGLEGKS